MINKIRNALKSILNQNETINVKLLQELHWANIFHDTIRGVKWLESCSISPNDMAANYSFLYIITRILKEIRPHSILEFGLGQSSKFINVFLINELFKTSHDIIEESDEWIKYFEFEKSVHCRVIKGNLTSVTRHNELIQAYDSLQDIIDKQYELYIIDGPRGKPSFSRFDICIIAESFNENSEFIILLDDYNRIGEQQTIEVLINLLKSKNIQFFSKTFTGIKTQILIVTKKYKPCISY